MLRWLMDHATAASVTARMYCLDRPAASSVPHGGTASAVLRGCTASENTSVFTATVRPRHSPRYTVPLDPLPSTSCSTSVSVMGHGVDAACQTWLWEGSGSVVLLCVTRGHVLPMSDRTPQLARFMQLPVCSPGWHRSQESCTATEHTPATGVTVNLLPVFSNQPGSSTHTTAASSTHPDLTCVPAYVPWVRHRHPKRRRQHARPHQSALNIHISQTPLSHSSHSRHSSLLSAALHLQCQAARRGQGSGQSLLTGPCGLWHAE